MPSTPDKFKAVRGICKWFSSTSEPLIRALANDSNVPKAEVDLGILNVGFGDVSYQGVKESGAAYIGMGACV